MAMLKRTRKQAITNDKQYLDEYFGICQLLLERNKLKRTTSNDSSLRNPLPQVKAKNEGEKNYEYLAKVIRKKDRDFWRRVETGHKRGREFAVEKFAAHYGLDLFEKKVLLLFFYIELTERRADYLEVSEIVQLVSIDESVAERMQKVLYFHKSKPLLKYELLKTCQLHYSSGMKSAYGADFEKLRLLCRMVNGENVSLPETNRESIDVDKLTEVVKEVGYAKEPEFTWENVILPENMKEKICFFLDSCKEKSVVPAGNIFLFYGPPGTGKTMLSEGLASYAGKKLLVLDFPKIINKYLGETEKQIVKAFKTAQTEKLVLVINEADSLLMSRSFSHWEYSIREVNVMLTELERYKGIAVLTTNMEVLLDPAEGPEIEFEGKI